MRDIARMMTIPKFVEQALAFVLLLSAIFPVAHGQTEKAPTLPVPGQIVEMTCLADSSQTYALYLPAAYSTTKRWPIVYFFDPGGRGRYPLNLYKQIAESYGFILAASNNSRNFAANQSASVHAVWQDTHVRLSVDEHRTYTGGFSGGARVAGAMAFSCSQCGIAGVIANGAGYPSNKSGEDNLPYFFAVGDQDFNWPEIMTVRREREDAGVPYRVHVFSGSHQWSPPAVMEDAIQWMNLKAMQSGAAAQDQAFIDKMLQQRQSEAAAAEKSKDAVSLLSAYRSLVSDFAGLRDTGEATKKLAALKQSPELKAALKAERDQISQQLDLEREIAPKMRTYESGSAPDQNALRVEIQQAMADLANRATHDKNEAKRLIFRRAFDDMWVSGMEDGEQELAAKHLERAEACFELMSLVKSDPWPSLMLAVTHVSAGNKKQALKDLQDSVRFGLKDATAIESEPRLQALKDDPAYQKIIAGLQHP
jgi:predicted esterase